MIAELGNIFNGQNSEIFSLKGEQIIKAVDTSFHGSHSEWKTNDRNPNEFESEVCGKVTGSQVKKWVNSLKDSRAAGLDKIPMLLFKNGSDNFYKKLTSL